MSRSAGFLAILFALVTVPAAADFSVGWISREPKIEYVWASANPTREGWPSLGQDVTWVAHVWNLTGSQQRDVGYRWTIDGATVSEGVVTLDPGQTELQLPWKWTFERHEIALEVDTADRVQESEERNNRLLIYSDAIAVGLWVERSFWDGIRPTIVKARIGAHTFADWMQLRIAQYNGMSALARYAETPDGVLDRWRIDEIHIVEDGALPLVTPGSDVREWGAGPTAWPILYPDSSDRTIDIQWGFPALSLQYYITGTPWTLLYDSFIHELGHARSMIDVYGWELNGRDRVEIIPGPPADQFGNYFINTEWGLMNTQWGFIDRFTAVALNRIAGRRAVEGTYNEPWDMGRFLNDLPAQNRVQLMTMDGTRFPGRTVRVYSSSSRLHTDWRQSASYQILIDNTPDLILTADHEGAVLVGRNPFSDADLSILVDRTNVMAIIEVVDGATSRWGYLESRLFNLAYWRGEKELAEHAVVLDAPICYPAGVGSNTYAPAYQALLTKPEVRFEFLGYKGHTYELWWSVDGRPAEHVEVPGPRLRDMNISPTVYIPRDGHVAWWYVDSDPDAPEICPPHPSGIFFFDLESGRGPRRRPARR